MKHVKELSEMIALAKTSGLKRIKVGSLEVELSDYELVQLYAEKLKGSENLTNANTATQSPSPSLEANPANQLTDEEDEEDMLFHSSPLR